MKRHARLPRLLSIPLIAFITIALTGCAPPSPGQPDDPGSSTTNSQTPSCEESCDELEEESVTTISDGEPRRVPQVLEETEPADSAPSPTSESSDAPIDLTPTPTRSAPSQNPESTDQEVGEVAPNEPIEDATGQYKISVIAPDRIASGSTLKVVIEVRDPNGLPVQTSLLPGAKFTVTWQGPGLLFQGTPESTDANGRAEFFVLLGANDSGLASVLAVFNTVASDPLNDILGFKQITVG